MPKAPAVPQLKRRAAAPLDLLRREFTPRGCVVPCSEAWRMRRWLPGQFSRSTPSALRQRITTLSEAPHQC